MRSEIAAHFKLSTNLPAASVLYAGLPNAADELRMPLEV
jgi:hypothetical protein